jgi:hypothetical protein
MSGASLCGNGVAGNVPGRNQVAAVSEIRPPGIEFPQLGRWGLSAGATRERPAGRGWTSGREVEWEGGKLPSAAWVTLLDARPWWRVVDWPPTPSGAAGSTRIGVRSARQWLVAAPDLRDPSLLQRISHCFGLQECGFDTAGATQDQDVAPKSFTLRKDTEPVRVLLVPSCSGSDTGVALLCAFELRCMERSQGRSLGFSVAFPLLVEIRVEENEHGRKDDDDGFCQGVNFTWFGFMAWQCSGPARGGYTSLPSTCPARTSSPATSCMVASRRPRPCARGPRRRWLPRTLASIVERQ